MIKRYILGVVSLLFSVNTFAAPNTATCDINTCFTEAVTTIPINSQALKNGTKFAWLKPSSGGGWSFGSKGASSSGSDGGGSWFMSVPDKGPINSKGTIVFYPAKSTFAAYDNMGNLVTSGRASGGMDYCEDEGRPCRTPTGTYRIYSKGDESCVSNKYPLGEGGAPMPYCMFFNGGYALHGSYYVPARPASHGCIRVTPDTAAWLHQNFVQVGTVIKIYSY